MTTESNVIKLTKAEQKVIDYLIWRRDESLMEGPSRTEVDFNMRLHNPMKVSVTERKAIEKLLRKGLVKLVKPEWTYEQPQYRFNFLTDTYTVLTISLV